MSDPASNYVHLACNSVQNQHILSDLCPNETARVLYGLPCIPNVNEDNGTIHSAMHILRLSLVIWCICIAVIAISGNLLTLVALPFARKKRRHRMDENWNTSTVFILHLAAVDLLFCIVCIPTFVIPFLSQGWDYGNMPCYGNICTRFSGMSYLKK